MELSTKAVSRYHHYELSALECNNVLKIEVVFK